jgi:hypothetical protein
MVIHIGCSATGILADAARELRSYWRRKSRADTSFPAGLLMGHERLEDATIYLRLGHLHEAMNTLNLTGQFRRKE